MLDKFLEVAYSREKTASNNRELVELLQKLPADELVRVASGTSELNKVAYCSPCGDGSWLDRFKGSPLFEQALAIEQQLLELEMAEAEKREGDQATWNARDKLNVQKRMLDLQLAQQGNGGEAPVPAPPVEQPELGQEPAAPAAPAPAPSRVEVKTAGPREDLYKHLSDRFKATGGYADIAQKLKVIKQTARESHAVAQRALKSKTAAELTEAARDKIKSKNFAISAKKSSTGEPAYPIHDKRHAANALARVKQHGTPAEKSEVYRDVAKKFPELAARSDVQAVRKKVAGARRIYTAGLPLSQELMMLGLLSGPALAGTAAGSYLGRELAGGAARAVAPEGREDRAFDTARKAALLGAPLGGLAGGTAGLLHGAMHGGPVRMFGTSALGALGGAALGGAGTGALVGGAHRLFGKKDSSTKEAMLGIGIDVASFGESDKMKGTINIGFPHGVSLNARHKPTGFGAGIGMAGVPVISWSPSTMADYEKSKKSKTAAVYAERFKAALAKEAALPKAMLDRARSIKDVVATKSPLTEVSFKSMLGKGTSSGPGRELAFKSLAKKAALSKEAIWFMGAAKGLIGAAKRGYGTGGLSGMAQGAGKMFGRVAKQNPLAAAGLVAAPVAAAGLGAGALAGRASA